MRKLIIVCLVLLNGCLYPVMSKEEAMAQYKAEKQRDLEYRAGRINRRTKLEIGKTNVNEVKNNWGKADYDDINTSAYGTIETLAYRDEYFINGNTIDCCEDYFLLFKNGILDSWSKQ